MSEATHGSRPGADTAPGDQTADEAEVGEGVAGYLIGLGLAVVLTVVAFLLPTLNIVWGPSIPIALGVLAVAQMGVHLVFFLHVTSGPDNANNILALAFGLLIVFLIIGGSIWIMHEMSANMMSNGGMSM